MLLGPAALMLVGDVPVGRGFWVDFGVVLGFIGLSMMILQFLLTARFWQVGKPFGVDVILRFHRRLGIIAFALVLGHVVIVIAANPSYLSFFDPRVNFPRAGALVTVLLALAALSVSSLWRRWFGLSYEWWRLLHAGLAALIVLIGTAHVMMVGHFTASWPKQAVWLTGAAGAFFLLFYIRLFQPWRSGRLPWRVVEVRPEASRTWTLVLEAVGHDGMRFEAGQYAWLTLGPTPFGLQQHPFTIASSPTRAERLEFSIKELGDFTATIPRVAVGTTAFLEGPYGHFTLRPEAPLTVFITGGIGITPAMSMLRDLRDRNSPHPCHLFYAAATLDKLAFRDELEDLARQLNLRVTFVLESPPPDWSGESGQIRADLVVRHLPAERLLEADYLICGPDPMIEAVQHALRALGVPRHHRRAERFNMV